MSQRSRASDKFTAIRTEGGLLPPDLLQRIASRSDDVTGMEPGDYHLGSGERLNEVIARSWNRLLGVWTAYQAEWEELVESDRGTTLTRERWLRPLLQELGYGRVMTSGGMEIEGKSYPVSHLWNHTPIHLLSARLDLDRRTRGVAGAAQASPHGMIQEFLNRSGDHLWAVLSNGHTLRVLRDNLSLSRQAFVEFDLKTIFDGELYSDFAVLWLVCHESRVSADDPERCWLEVWCQEARERGVRALDALRGGVERAIETLGCGFLAHPRNRALREALRNGDITPREYYRLLLRAIYRLIFLFVAEDRDLLLLPESEASEGARSRYRRFYSTARIRDLAQTRRGTRHADLWEGLRVVVQALRSEDGCPPLALPGLGGFLWSEPAGEDWALANRTFLEAVRRLAMVEEDRRFRRVDFRNLGPEELGSVYESLLELEPEVGEHASQFHLRAMEGNERKSTGSYYTPESLIQRLLDSALDPVLREALNSPDPERALLDLKVIDPAVGSGHFLLSAAHRIAGRLAAVRSGEDEPSPLEVQRALRDVISRCLFGVDVNPMAAELCKVSLWLEALDPGKPLSFLDHHIQVGNSLLGATPALLEAGIPDDAFVTQKVIEGDDKKWVRSLRKQNRDERKGQTTFLTRLVAESRATYQAVENEVSVLEAGADDSIGSVRRKEQAFRRLREGAEYSHSALVADAWCAAFVWPKRDGAPDPITEATFREIQRNPDKVEKEVRDEVRRLAERYRFFHFHLAFPQVFRLPGNGEVASQAGWAGGFDVVLGNPPWDKIEFKEKEWFASRSPGIADAAGSKRKLMIRELSSDDPALAAAFRQAKREVDAAGHFARNAGRFPLCGRGRMNTYALFAELKRDLISDTGRVGCIVQSGIATDDTTKYFFQDVVESGMLHSLFDFENRRGIFPGVHRSFKFCLLTLRGRAVADADDGAEFAFFLQGADELDDQDRRFELTADDIALLNPNTRTCPIFRTRRDAEITKAIYRRVPVLVREGPPEKNPWGVGFMQGLFNMTSDSEHFRTLEELEEEGWQLHGNIFVRDDQRYVPLYEAKMIHHFDHQWATYEDGSFRDVTEEEKADPEFHVMPRYWVPEREVEERLAGKWDEEWLLGWRRICRSTDERSVIASAIPRHGAGDSIFLLRSELGQASVSLAGVLSSLVFDFVARNKVGGTNLSFFLMAQLPVPPPERLNQPCPWSPHVSTRTWLEERVSKLAGLDLQSRTGAVWASREGRPSTRADVRAEIDAAVFQLYGLSRSEVSYVMDTFPILERKDRKQFGEYVTKRRVLETFERLRRASSPLEPLETPALPEAPPALDPLEMVPLVVLALVWARGGTVSRVDLACAFALWRDPELTQSLAPAGLQPAVHRWSEASGTRTIPPEVLGGTVKELVDRHVLRFSTDGSSTATVEVTSATPEARELDDWFRSEAALILSVMDGVTSRERSGIHEALPIEEREFIEPGAA